jgi:hypothetical protein
VPPNPQVHVSFRSEIREITPCSCTSRRCALY